MYNLYSSCLFLFIFIGFLGTTFAYLQEITFNGPHRNKANKVVICHVEVWSVYRPDAGRFGFEDIDPTLCTHLIFGYNHLNETTDDIIAFESWTEFLGTNPHENISKLKLKNPDIKMLVSVGGWLDGSIKYSRMAANSTRIERFVNNTLAFLTDNGLDGMELIWQYPGKRGGSTRDKENYIQLLRVI